MKIVMTMKWSGVTPEQYDVTRKIVNMDNEAPKGLVLHAAGFDENGIRVTDIWDSADDFNNYVQGHLMAATKAAGIQGEPHVEIFPLHATLTPGVEQLS